MKRTTKKCWCGKKFTTNNPAQKHCCPRHEHIYTRARMSKYGQDLVRDNPKAALRWYDYMT